LNNLLDGSDLLNEASWMPKIYENEQMDDEEKTSEKSEKTKRKRETSEKSENVEAKSENKMKSEASSSGSNACITKALKIAFRESGININEEQLATHIRIYNQKRPELANELALRNFLKECVNIRISEKKIS